MASIGHNQPAKISIDALTPEQRERVKKAIMELNDSLTRQAAEREFQKEAIDDLNKQIGVDKKLVRRIAKTYFKDSLTQETDDNFTFESSYRKLFPSKIGD
jgi:neutral trehalase